MGFPRSYKVEVSLDGVNWGKTPVAQGQGDDLTIISFKPVQAKFVRITQTATDAAAPPWSIQRLRLFEPGKPVAK